MDEPASNSSSVQVSYPAYPTLQPITSEPPAGSYALYTAPPQHEYSHGYSQQGGQPTSYQQPQMQQQPQLEQPQLQQPQQQQQLYQDLNGGQSPYGASQYGQQAVQAQSSYPQVMRCRVLCWCLLSGGCSVMAVPCAMATVHLHAHWTPGNCGVNVIVQWMALIR